MEEKDQVDQRLDDPRLLAAAQEYLVALEAGESPTLESFTGRFPEIASELAACLEGLALLHDVAPPPSPAQTPVTPQTNDCLMPLGDFRLIREIGRGGMGVVYEAVQLSLGRRVAVKVLPFASALDMRHLQRFRNEAQAAAQLHHTNIVPVFAVGVERGVHFYAMQLIDGQPLSALISHRRGRDFAGCDNSTTGSSVDPNVDKLLTTIDISTRAVAQDGTHRDAHRGAVELIRQAAGALEHAHQCGVIHRDVKPGNLLVDQFAHVWITDFGLAHIVSDVNLTHTGEALGTARYMSPEQAAGNRTMLDHRTDIYSLGVTLYELLALQPIFVAESRLELIRQVMHDEPRALRSVNRDIPLDLETIINKAISKAPEDRYPTAQAMADDLQRWLDDQPILARRPTVMERTARWGRRHRAAMRSILVVGLLTSVGLLVSTILVLREQAATKRAYQREVAEHAAAVRSFRQARDAVDSFTALAEEELADDPKLQIPRRMFLDRALAYYRDFLHERRDDPSVRAELEASLNRMQRISDGLAAIEGFAPLTLLANEQVRQELHASPSQSKQLDRLVSQLRDDQQQLRSESDLSNSEDKVRQRTQMLRAHERQLEVVLSPEQLRRLKQITWQQQGPFVFKNQEIVQLLNLSADQRKQINRIIAEENPTSKRVGNTPGNESLIERSDFKRGPPPKPGSHEADLAAEWLLGSSAGHSAGPYGTNAPGTPGGPPSRPPPDSFKPPPKPPYEASPHNVYSGRMIPEEMRAHRQRTMTRSLELLTAEQRANWDELIGKPVDLNLPRGPEQWSPR